MALCMPLPWDEGETIRAALMVYESAALARAGLEHYLARTGQEPSSYSLREISAEDLIEMLEARRESFARVAINPILSLYFPEAEGYAASFAAQDFIADLKELVDISRR